MYKGFYAKNYIPIIDKMNEPTVFFWFSLCLFAAPCIMASFTFFYIIDPSLFSFIADDELIEYIPKFREDYIFLSEIYGSSYAAFFNKYAIILSIIGFLLTLPLSTVLILKITLNGINNKHFKYNKYIIMIFLYILVIYFVYAHPTVYENPQSSRGAAIPVNYLGMIALLFIYSSLNIAYVLFVAVIAKYIKYKIKI
ncbi:MAG: hypothetical protein P1V21_11320 [Rhizobiaceae bacterium]|nr:hypothetical protein [Rhizobiaceae bacterium]